MKRYKKAELASMATDRLAGLLREEMDKQPLNGRLIRQILAILDKRGPEVPPVALSEKEAADWEKFEDLYAAERARGREERSAARRKRIKWTGAVAACVLLLVVFVLPPVLGANSIVDLARELANEVLTFFSPDDTGGECQFQTDHPGLQELHDTLTELGITAPVVPTWLPDGFVLDEIKVIDYPSKTEVYSAFLHEDKFVIFIAGVTGSDPSSVLESDYPDVTPVEFGGIKYYMTANENSTTVLWKNGNISCSLFTNADAENCYGILRSIQRKVATQ